MMRMEHTVHIDRGLPEVYALARQVERYPEFLPGYLESCIVERKGDAILLNRKAIVRGKLRQWQSWVRFIDNDLIKFEHAAGPLKGMKIEWSFKSLSDKQTRLQIVHHLHVPRRWPWGWLLEKTYYGPAVSRMADGVVQDFKRACEGARSLI